MDLRQMKVQQALHRVVRFVDSNSKVLGPVSSSGACKAVEEIIRDLEQCARIRAGAGRASSAETATQKRLRADLRYTYMRPIATIAKLRLQDAPELGEMRLPHITVSRKRLLAAAAAMARAADRYREVFVNDGLPPHFVAELQAMIRAYQHALATRFAARQAQTCATATIEDLNRRGRLAIRVLDALVQSRLRKLQ